MAFALGRALGPAVVRNRVRRQLRDILRAASSAGRLPPGLYLVGAQPAAASRTFTELEFDVQHLTDRLSRADAPRS